jgi:hypothetical protein
MGNYVDCNAIYCCRWHLLSFKCWPLGNKISVLIMALLSIKVNEATAGCKVVNPIRQLVYVYLFLLSEPLAQPKNALVNPPPQIWKRLQSQFSTAHYVGTARAHVRKGSLKRTRECSLRSTENNCKHKNYDFTSVVNLLAL